MGDCDKLRAMLTGLPDCCPVCHTWEHMTDVRLDGQGLEICCTLMSEIIRRHGGFSEADWTIDEPVMGWSEPVCLAAPR
jgi:hypothetical protein